MDVELEEPIVSIPKRYVRKPLLRGDQSSKRGDPLL
jgi:hypothetical protein